MPDRIDPERLRPSLVDAAWQAQSSVSARCVRRVLAAHYEALLADDEAMDRAVREFHAAVSWVNSRDDRSAMRAAILAAAMEPRP